MAIHKLIAFSSMVIFFGVLAQFSNAQNSSTTQFNSIQNIVDPAKVIGTEVRIEDLN